MLQFKPECSSAESNGDQPLDGSSLPLLVLPEAAARKYFDVMRSPILQLVGFVIISRGIGSFFAPILAFAASLLHPGSHYG